MASGSRPLHIANDAAFPVLNSGSDELTQSLQDGPAFSKLLIGSLETHRQQFAVVVFIATAATASESGVGKQAAPKGHWTLVTDIPEEFREYWVAADAHTETHVFHEGFLAVHPPSGILVAGSSNRMRAAMTTTRALHTSQPASERWTSTSWPPSLCCLPKNRRENEVLASTPPTSQSATRPAAGSAAPTHSSATHGSGWCGRHCGRSTHCPPCPRVHSLMQCCGFASIIMTASGCPMLFIS